MKRMTNQELARWCNLMFGEVCVDGKVCTCYSYDIGKTNELVPLGIKIRPWGSNIWIDPADDRPQYEGHNI